MPESTRDRLISVAADLFYEHGFHAIGLDRVLAEVGVTKTTFYNHFESKDALIIAVLEHRDRVETEEWFDYIRQQSGREPRDQLLGFFDLLEDWMGKPEFRGCLFMKAAAEFPQMNDPIHITASKHSQGMFVLIRDLAKEGGAEDPESLAKQLMVLIGGAIVAGHGALEKLAAQTAKCTASLLIDRHMPLVGTGA